MVDSQREHGWAIFDSKRKQFLGIDRDSGGYPYWPDRSGSIAIFQSWNAASDYKQGFVRSPQTFPDAHTWQIKEINRGIEVLS